MLCQSTNQIAEIKIRALVCFWGLVPIPFRKGIFLLKGEFLQLLVFFRVSCNDVYNENKPVSFAQFTCFTLNLIYKFHQKLILSYEIISSILWLGHEFIDGLYLFLVSHSSPLHIRFS
jgi:hypothetical protein